MQDSFGRTANVIFGIEGAQGLMPMSLLVLVKRDGHVSL
jgi:hypothetical protein